MRLEIEFLDPNDTNLSPEVRQAFVRIAANHELDRLEDVMKAEKQIPRLIANVPAELRERNQYLAWKFELSLTNGKPPKVPFEAIGRGRFTHNRELVSFKLACDRLRIGGFDGIGYRFLENDPFVGIDLDGVRAPSGELTHDAKEIIRACGTYAEVSPSGTGVKLFGRAVLPGKCSQRKLQDGTGIEIYDRDQYFTLTGDKLPECPSVCADIQGVVNQLVRMYFPEIGRAEVKPPNEGDYAESLRKMRNYICRNGFDVREKQTPKSTKFLLRNCPFNWDHQKTDAYFFVMNSGAYGFKCSHTSCASNKMRQIEDRFGRFNQ